MKLKSNQKAILIATAITVSALNSQAASSSDVNTKTEQTSSLGGDNKTASIALSPNEIKPIEQHELKKNKMSPRDIKSDKILLFILCFFIPPIAVGFATNWKMKRVLIALLLTLLFWLPGVIYALITVNNRRS